MYIDLTGHKYNRLTVISIASPGSKNTSAKWNCLCDCGKMKIISSNSLRRNSTKSCGCLNDELRRSRSGENNPFFKKDKSDSIFYGTYGSRKVAKKLNHVPYRITNKEYEELDSKQNGLCVICGVHKSLQTYKKLYIDHDHNTGKVRGLLCNSCNLILGHSQDNIDILNKAINYLKSNVG